MTRLKNAALYTVDDVANADNYMIALWQEAEQQWLAEVFVNGGSITVHSAFSRAKALACAEMTVEEAIETTATKCGQS